MTLVFVGDQSLVYFQLLLIVVIYFRGSLLLEVKHLSLWIMRVIRRGVRCTRVLDTRGDIVAVVYALEIIAVEIVCAFIEVLLPLLTQQPITVVVIVVDYVAVSHTCMLAVLHIYIGYRVHFALNVVYLHRVLLDAMRPLCYLVFDPTHGLMILTDQFTFFLYIVHKLCMVSLAILEYKYTFAISHIPKKLAFEPFLILMVFLINNTTVTRHHIVSKIP